MTKGKSLIEKIWWVIPPVVVVFGTPLVYTLKEMIEWSQPPSLFVWSYCKHFSYMIEYFTLLSGSVAISTFGFMGIGYYLIRRKSLLLRIIVPIISGTMGFLISLAIAAMMYA